MRLSSDAPVGHAQFVNQAVGVDVVETIPCGDIRRLIREDRGEIRILAIEVDQIRAEVTLLQQIAGARKVVNPRSGSSAHVSLRLNHWPKGPSVNPGALLISGWCADS